MEKFRKLDFVLEFDLKKEEESLFWLKVDTLIEEVASNEDTSGSYEMALKNNWGRFFDVPYSRRVYMYLRKHKLPYKLIRDSGVDTIKSDNFIYNVLLNSMFKLLVIENEFIKQGEIEELLKNKVRDLKISQNFIDNEVSALMQHYFKFSFPIKEFKDALIPYKGVYERLYDISKRHLESKDKGNVLESEDIKAKGISSESNRDSSKSDKDNSSASEIKRLRDEYYLAMENSKKENENLKEEIIALKARLRESFNYSVNQYDTGVKDLFNEFNNKNYGNIIDRFYCHINGIKVLNEKEMSMLVKNLMLSIEQFGINSYSNKEIGECFKAKEHNMEEEYRLNTALESEEVEVRVVFPGWKYKDNTIVAPLVKTNL